MREINSTSSPNALAIANHAMIIALFDQLVGKQVFGFGGVKNVIQSAIDGLGGRVQTEDGAEALKVLQSLLREWSNN